MLQVATIARVGSKERPLPLKRGDMCAAICAVERLIFLDIGFFSKSFSRSCSSGDFGSGAVLLVLIQTPWLADSQLNRPSSPVNNEHPISHQSLWFLPQGTLGNVFDKRPHAPVEEIWLRCSCLCARPDPGLSFPYPSIPLYSRQGLYLDLSAPCPARGWHLAHLSFSKTLHRAF